MSFWKEPVRVRDFSQHKNNAKLLLMTIATHANANGFAWVGMKSLADSIGFTNEDSVSRLVRKLKASGELWVIKNRRPYAYIILVGCGADEMARRLVVHLRITVSQAETIVAGLIKAHPHLLVCEDQKPDRSAGLADDPDPKPDRSAGANPTVQPLEPDTLAVKPDPAWRAKLMNDSNDQGQREKTPLPTPAVQLQLDLAWQATRDQFESSLSRAVFQTWVEDLQFVSLADETLTLRARNHYQQQWVVRLARRLIQVYATMRSVLRSRYDGMACTVRQLVVVAEGCEAMTVEAA